MAAHRAWLTWGPVTRDGAVSVQGSVKLPKAVRQLEGQLSSVHPDRNSLPDHVSREGRAAALDDQRPACVGAEPALCFPEADQLVTGSGSRFIRSEEHTSELQSP